MRALTLTQPWAWAVAFGGKNVENRTWPPPRTLPAGELIAIHAGKGWDRAGFEWLRARALLLGIPLCPPPGQHVHGRIVAVCRVPGFFSPHPGRDPNPWFQNEPGNHGWHLIDVARLPDPVEARGAQGLFELPPAVEGAILVSLERWRSCRSCSRARAQRYGPPACELREDPAMFDAGGCAGWRPR